jgi:hypothetical protein
VRDIAEARSKLLDQPGLADAWLANDEQKLPFAGAGPFPPAGEHVKVILASDELRDNSRAGSAAAATWAHDAIERDRKRNSLKFMRALVLNDEEPSDLPLDVRGDQNCSRLGCCLNPRGNVGYFAEHLATRVDDDGAAFKPDAGDQFRNLSAEVARVEVGERTLDR